MSIRPANRLEKECKIMRKIILLVAVFCLSTMLFADTAKSKSATLKFDMTGEKYVFGFAENLDKAKSGTESTEFVINDDETKTDVTKTIYFFWKAFTPNKMKITLSSNGPLKKVDNPSPYQRIDYQITVNPISDTSWWPVGASLSSNNTIVKSTDTNSSVSANLKGTVNYYYTQGICVLNFAIVDSSGNQIANIDSLRTSKEGGSYSSTITLEISSV